MCVKQENSPSMNTTLLWNCFISRGSDHKSRKRGCVLTHISHAHKSQAKFCGGGGVCVCVWGGGGGVCQFEISMVSGLVYFYQFILRRNI